IPLLLVVLGLYLWAGPRRKSVVQVPATPPLVEATGVRRAGSLALPASPLRVAVTLFLLTVLVAGSISFFGWLCDCVLPVSSDVQYHGIFAAAALAICLFTPHACGLGGGSSARWQRHDLECAVVFAVPPIL